MSRIKSLQNKRALQFDENNIRQINPLFKDYGLAIVNKSSTPFPRTVDPVTPRLLRKRLEKLLEELNVNEIGRPLKSLASTLQFSSSESPSTQESDDQKSWRSELFKKKRQEFVRHEFTIAKQSKMSYMKQQSGFSSKRDRCVSNGSNTYRANLSFEAKVDALLENL